MPPGRSSRAAGGVLWRPGRAGVEIAVVHRPRYDDWSLPKGHLDDGEHPAVAAVREIREEAGYTATLGRFLGRATYPLRHRDKRVDFWAARAGTGGFVPNDETDELRWSSAAGARDILSYPTDAEMVGEFERVPAADAHTMILVRHAQAEPGPDDAARRLTARGRAQAVALVPVLLAFGASSVHAAALTRCEETARPLSEALGEKIHREPTLPESVYGADRAAAARRIADIGHSLGVPVVFSQDGVIPDVVRHYAIDAGMMVPELRTSTAQPWAITTAGGRVVALDRMESPDC